jgi:hypothetical protein
MSINIQRNESNSKTIGIPIDQESSAFASISKNKGNSRYPENQPSFSMESLSGSEGVPDELGLDYLANRSKEIEEESESVEVEGSNGSEDFAARNYMDIPENHHDPEQYISFEEEQALRSRYLVQLKRLNSKGYPSSRRFGPEDSSSSIKAEIMRIKKEREVESGINYCKQGLVFFANTIEMVNSFVPNSPAHLDGWSAHIMRTQDDYDEVFEELYLKYAGNIEMGPEIKLITMIAGSAFMFHLNKLLAEKAMNGGNIQDILGKMMKNKPKESSGKKKEMSGPTLDSEELLKKLSSDNFSDISSNMSDDSEEEVIEKPKKKRGRPKK